MAIRGRALKRIAKVLGLALGIVLVLAALGMTWVAVELSRSLPRLEGDAVLEGLSAPVRIERDALGVPTITGQDRLDVAAATGFVHAQERFFQMDLLRRRAAGELAEIIGPVLLDEDRRHRVHRFRALAEARLATADAEMASMLAAYARGVNAGLAALGTAPPEYLVLRVDPEPWTPADTILVVLSMYLELESDQAGLDSDRGLLHELLPADLAAFLDPPGTEWDAPLVGDPPPAPALLAETGTFRVSQGTQALPRETRNVPVSPGSNGWAVDGAHSDDGGALLANDLHLPLALPNIWYRVSLVWRDASGDERRVTGITLPGAPPVVVGSNGHVAWGFTNGQVDVGDLVLLESDPQDATRYLTPDGPRRFERFDETLLARGAPAEHLEVLWTIWGPVVDRDWRGRARALRWVAHDPASVDLGLLRMELARDLDQALAVAASTHIPTQNCQLADRAGRVAWTLIGPLPRRVGCDGHTPRSWADGTCRWEGELPRGERPVVADPPAGRVWSANNRIGSGGAFDAIGDGGFDLGARARQIRDDLFAVERASERDMLKVQLDDRALFLERWRRLLLDVLTDEAVASSPRRAELRRVVEEQWSGHASIDSAGFRLVSAFRSTVAERVLGSLTAPCRAADERFGVFALQQAEGPLWTIVTTRPPQLLDPERASWDDELLAAVDSTLAKFAPEERPLAERTWGERNLVRIRHPFSLAVPQLARWLDIPPEPLPGANHMPRVQAPSFGASMRMVVSPGREDEGLFHMPGGQSGHPRSPYYRAGHAAWAQGLPTPFLPGPAVHVLTLSPAPV